MPAKLQLPDVTLITVTSINIDQTHAALLHCCQLIDFGAAKMLCSAVPKFRDPRIEYVLIPPLDFIGYSRFMIGTLHEFVQTSHCLVVQADGFVLNAAHWRHRFLKYDYIGAPWPEFVGLIGRPGQRLQLGKNRVGNGGFSLRSKKLLTALCRLNFDAFDFMEKSEDLLIGHYLFDEMQAAGIQFPNIKLASSFSLEIPIPNVSQPLGSVFGFHGKQWLPSVYQVYPWLKV